MYRIRIPGDIDVPIRLFGRFTLKDLARLWLPVVPGLVQASPIVLVLGSVIGIGWYGIRPYDRPVDSHIYNFARWLIGVREIQKMDLSTAEDSGWDRNIEDGIIRTGNGGLVAVIEVDPTNLDLKTEAEQQALHSVYQELFQMTNYPLQIHTDQRGATFENYVQYLEEKSSENDVLKSDYIEHCEDLDHGSLVVTRHFLVLHIERNSVGYSKDWYKRIVSGNQKPSEEEMLSDELDSRCRDIISKIDTSELSGERVAGDELREYAKKANYDKRHHGVIWNWTDAHTRTVRITEYPSRVELAWPLQLLRAGEKVDIVQKIEPVDASETTEKLQRMSEKLVAEIDSLLGAGYRRTNKLETLLDDTEWFLNLLAEREGRPVKYSSCITVRGQSREEARRSFEKVCNRLDTLGFEYSHPVFRSDLAYRSNSPLYRHGLGDALLMPASSAAAGFPFATYSPKDWGIVYGTESHDGMPVLFNRFNWSSHSMALMGMVGSGKSYAAKIELLRSRLVYDDLEIIVIDPKQEYSNLIEKLGGDIREVDTDTICFSGNLTCITVSERGQKQNIELLTKAVERIYSHVSNDSRKTLVVIDEARILLNDEDGRRVLNQFVLEGRDTNTAINLITQNASHLTYCREGREILDNMPGKVFMRHDRVPDDVVEYFRLSQREKQELFELRTGTDSEYSEGIFHVSGRIKTRLRIDSTPQEDLLIRSGEK